ncbi:MAG: AI-2E family transporter [Planctomycetota bacterium]|nr:AI-2E family transporter [Planctomycetota bacterium]
MAEREGPERSDDRGDRPRDRGRRRRRRGRPQRPEERAEADGRPPRDRGDARRDRSNRGRDRRRPSRENILGIAVLIVALTAFSVAGAFIFLPFVTPLLVALVFTTVSYPLFEKVLALMGSRRRGLAAALTCATFLLVVFLPLGWVVWTFADEAVDGVPRVQAMIGELRGPGALEELRDRRYAALWGRVTRALRVLKGPAEETPESPTSEGDGDPPPPDPDPPPDPPPPDPPPAGAGEAKEDGATEPVAVEDLLQLVGWLTRGLASLLTGIFGALVNFFLLVFIMFYFYKDGPRLLESLKRSVPVDEHYKNKVVDTFREVTKSIVRGTVATAVAQGALATVGFAILGMPAAVFWGALVAVCALVPVVGTALVTVPLILAYSLDGQLWWQGFYLAVLAVIVSASDNLLRPLFLQGGLRLHPLWILLSILGGVSVFGGLGLVLGPMIVVFIGTFLALVTEQSPATERVPER